MSDDASVSTDRRRVQNGDGRSDIYASVSSGIRSCFASPPGCKIGPPSEDHAYTQGTHRLPSAHTVLERGGARGRYGIGRRRGGIVGDEREDLLLRSVALQDAYNVLTARRRVDQELLLTRDALEEETRILELLNQTGIAFASNLDVQALVQAVTDAGTELSGAEFGAFFYSATDESGEIFTLYTLSGAPREAFEKFGHPRATPIFKPTFEGRGVVRSGNIRTDPRYGKMAPHFGMPAGHLPVCSYLAVPVVARSGEVIGGLFFGHHRPDVFTERAERLMIGVAAQAGVAIENARLYEAATRATEAERAARSEVERVSVMKDEFLATLSHELRTPLNSIVGWAELLVAQTERDTQVHHGLETIARNAHAQARLIEDLLDMNRIVSGKIRLDVQRVDLPSVIELAVEASRPSAAAKSIQLRTELDPEAGPVQGDPHRLQQVVWNLLTNAVKFTPKEGKIDVLLRRVNSQVELSVIDSGIGLSVELLPHVFERFKQADSSTTRKYGGLGLGLSIVKQLVELHGGTVQAESAGANLGSAFRICLPLSVREREDSVYPVARVSSTPPPPIRLSGVKILIVDDEPDARDLLQAMLSAWGAEIVTAASAREGLVAVGSYVPDVIVSDIGMPDVDGYAFIRAVRKLPPAQGGKTPAVALTAFARSEDRTRALLAGYQVHVAKPIEPHELVVTIGSLTGRTGD
jgi:signal transduction histidine kinase